MDNLTIVNQNGQLVTDSRNVAQMIGKEHDQLMRSIRTYIEYLESAKMQSLNFFIPGTYINSQNKEQPCYLLTKKGCDMVANKMTGEKGILFTATYVTRFEEMEKTFRSQFDTAQLSPHLQMFNQMFQALANNELEQKRLHEEIAITKEETAAVKEEIKNMRDVIALNPNSWRPDSSSLINKIALAMGGYEHIKVIREESYSLLNERMGVDLKTRLTNKRRRMADEGVCKSKRDKLNIVDVIADDKKLIGGYVAIVKEMAIKYSI